MRQKVMCVDDVEVTVHGHRVAMLRKNKEAKRMTKTERITKYAYKNA